jgi:hypothetical protein
MRAELLYGSAMSPNVRRPVYCNFDVCYSIREHLARFDHCCPRRIEFYWNVKWS